MSETSIYDIYESNLDLEEEGVWVNLTKTIEVKVAALGNRKHTNLLTKLQKAQGKTLENDADLREDIHVQAMAKTVLLDWKGITDKDGKPLKYSYENAYKLLSDEKMYRFKKDILFLSQEAETFKAQEEEADAKNSKKSSDGS